MYVVHRSPDMFIIEHLSKAEAHILALRSLNLPFKYIITLLFLYPLLLGAPLPLGALRVRVVCLWVNLALETGSIETQTNADCQPLHQVSRKRLHRRLAILSGLPTDWKSQTGFRVHGTTFNDLE